MQQTTPFFAVVGGDEAFSQIALSSIVFFVIFKGALYIC